jgi:hypothetical protein
MHFWIIHVLHVNSETSNLHALPRTQVNRTKFVFAESATGHSKF